MNFTAGQIEILLVLVNQRIWKSIRNYGTTTSYEDQLLIIVSILTGDSE